MLNESPAPFWRRQLLFYPMTAARKFRREYPHTDGKTSTKSYFDAEEYRSARRLSRWVKRLREVLPNKTAQQPCQALRCISADD